MKKIIVNFLKDKLLFSITWFLNSILIILFFSLYTKQAVPFVYPMIMCTFIYIVYMCIELYRYINFNNSLNKIPENPMFNMMTYDCEQEHISRAFNKIHNNYINEINNIKESNTNRERFFSQWIHNMKTPISVIELILQKSKDNRKYDDFIIDEIRAENDKLLQNLDNALDFIRLEEFSEDYELETIDIVEFIKNILVSKKRELIHNNVFPKLQYDDEITEVLSDRKWNEHMVSQLISNAIKYSTDHNKSKNIYFSVSKEEKYTVLEIRDEGIGIPEYDIDRVFEPFFTGENGRRIKKSSGIGLYICRLIAEKLEHKIHIESKVGEGTIVKIRYLSKS